MAKKKTKITKGSTRDPALSEFEYNRFNASVGPEGYEESGLHRYLVFIKSYRVKLVDEDSLAGGAKYHIDSLRRAGLIPDDAPGFVKLEFDQEKVSKKSDERVETTISMIDSR